MIPMVIFMVAVPWLITASVAFYTRKKAHKRAR